ncbi:MAG TPA: S9 family peptidase [Saprospiraceae bacterium]|nr:S9 family peptidase [Saprospiraceae bacterium]HRP40754.1 S9 family peptidase [Saprospiraceae bacterium]
MSYIRFLSLSLGLILFISCSAQKAVDKPVLPSQGAHLVSMNPDLLWQLKRVSATGISKDGRELVYKVSTPNVDSNTFSGQYFKVPVQGGTSVMLDKKDGLVRDKNISPDGKYLLFDKAVKIEKVNGNDFHPDMKNTTAQIYTALDYRHWDTWNDGSYNHVLYRNADAPETSSIDIMGQEAYNSPQKPFGGDEDYIWSPDSKYILYVSKKLTGTKAVVSTNTDIYQYELATGKTTNLTADNKGYDTNPQYSVNGDLAWLSMATDGNEADKNDIKVLSNGIVMNLTAHWDETVMSYKWSNDGRKLYFIAAVDGTLQLFSVIFPGKTKIMPLVQQLTKGDWDVNGIIGETGELVIVSRTTMNRATELFSYNLKTERWNQLTHVNDDLYKNIADCRTERRYITTTDGKQMLVWVIYPPGFDATKKYPTLLYCQGGPQSALTQFYSFRWNFQLMASNGYIVVAPNRRGMPGHGVEWNRQISKDYGGQNMRDYLSAIDAMAKEPYVDKDRLGAIGASYGGYSVFYLAGIHNKRFKSFIAHDGIFNWQSMYGTTEEMFFVNNDIGGPYWDDANRKGYTDFNPVNLVAKWDTPIYIIQGGKDYRVPIGQGLEAFNAAQLKGLKSKLLYFPDENHWVMKPQNSIVWHREFFKWLRETL